MNVKLNSLWSYARVLLSCGRSFRRSSWRRWRKLDLSSPHVSKETGSASTGLNTMNSFMQNTKLFCNPAHLTEPSVISDLSGSFWGLRTLTAGSGTAGRRWHRSWKLFIWKRCVRKIYSWEYRNTLRLKRLTWCSNWRRRWLVLMLVMIKFI